jgi:hypothetical protein
MQIQNSQKHFEDNLLNKGEADLEGARAYDQFNSGNESMIRDYLLPEIRALEDRTDVGSIKKAMKYTKITDRGISFGHD